MPEFIISFAFQVCHFAVRFRFDGARLSAGFTPFSSADARLADAVILTPIFCRRRRHVCYRLFDAAATLARR
jgi:hypothetical protein